MLDRAWLLSRFYRVAYQGARVYWFLARPTKRGVKCVLYRGDEVILVRHTYGNRKLWELPGGAIKRGEAPLDAARREMREELAVDPPSWTALGHFRTREEHRRDTVHVFEAALDGAEPVRDRVEIAEVRWFAPDALPAPLGGFARRTLAIRSAARAGRVTAAESEPSPRMRADRL